MQLWLSFLSFPFSSFLFGIVPLFSPLINIVFIPFFGFVVFPLMVSSQIAGILNEQWLPIWSRILKIILDLFFKFGNRIPALYFNLPFNFIVALLSLIGVSFYKYRKGWRWVIYLFVIIQIGGGLYVLERDQSKLIISEEMMDVELRRYIPGDGGRNSILRRINTYPVMISVRGDALEVRRGIFCRSFLLPGKGKTQRSCQLGDIFVSLFQPVAKSFRNIFNHNIPQFAIPLG